ncbi:hypothetical protein J7297_02390 [Nakaseomyces glabratus]|nr:hypothetical protein J7297_02390 [Nakaseomyces glabratus]KAH7592287.1 hypothetical protein J7296_02388 [Nakaseomyces glabratus]KTB15969.1 Increased copper sensitivity protein 2 [Nakaseomyces glabratus]KTB25326.1 Increased copper sensitivity protein 2 [Nakaseomyces glabratus]
MKSYLPQFSFESKEKSPSESKRRNRGIVDRLKKFNFPQVQSNDKSQNLGNSHPPDDRVTIRTISNDSSDDHRVFSNYTYSTRDSFPSSHSENYELPKTPPPITPSGSPRRYKHRKSNAISVSTPEELYLPKTPDHNSDIYREDEGVFYLSSPTSDIISYKHQLSPETTIRDTKEQLRRNTVVGVANSLTEFAEKNRLDISGKVFADINDTPPPLIDLGKITENLNE